MILNRADTNAMILMPTDCEFHTVLHSLITFLNHHFQLLPPDRPTLFPLYPFLDLFHIDPTPSTPTSPNPPLEVNHHHSKNPSFLLRMQVIKPYLDDIPCVTESRFLAMTLFE